MIINLLVYVPHILLTLVNLSMSIRYPSGDVKWAIASTGLTLRRAVRDFDDHLEVVTIVSIQSHGTRELHLGKQGR